MGWVCEEEKRITFWQLFALTSVFKFIFCIIIFAWILGNRFLTSVFGGKKEVQVVKLILK